MKDGGVRRRKVTNRCKRKSDVWRRESKNWRMTGRRERDSRAVTGSSSENEEVSGKWKWDGENWWFRVDHRGPINSRLRRKISRAAKTTIDETKKWGDELFQLGSRVEWLETETQRAQQTKHGSVTLPESKHQGRPAGNQECPRAAN